MAISTNKDYRPRKYSFGGGLLVGSLIGGYLGYKIGKYGKQTTIEGFEKEKQVLHKTKMGAKKLGKKLTKGIKYDNGGGVPKYPNDLSKDEAEKLFKLAYPKYKVGDRIWNNFKRTPLKLIYANLDEQEIKYDNGGNVSISDEDLARIQQAVAQASPQKKGFMDNIVGNSPLSQQNQISQKDAMQFVKENPEVLKLLLLRKGGKIDSENYQMLRGKIKEVEHHAKELKSITNRKKEVPAWVLAKSTRASTDMSDITHYMDSAKFDKGGNVSFKEQQINEISSWDNDEIANFLQIPESQVANDRNRYIREAQSVFMLSSYGNGGGVGKKNLSENEANKIADNFGFNLDEFNSNDVIFSTRKNGYISSGKFGDKDLAEAQKLSKYIIENFDVEKTKIESVDEFVLVIVEQKPKFNPKDLQESFMPFAKYTMTSIIENVIRETASKNILYNKISQPYVSAIEPSQYWSSSGTTFQTYNVSWQSYDGFNWQKETNKITNLKKPFNEYISNLKVYLLKAIQKKLPNGFEKVDIDIQYTLREHQNKYISGVDMKIYTKFYAFGYVEEDDTDFDKDYRAKIMGTYLYSKGGYLVEYDRNKKTIIGTKKETDDFVKTLKENGHTNIVVTSKKSFVEKMESDKTKLKDYLQNKYKINPIEYSLFKNEKGKWKISPINLRSWFSKYGSLQDIEKEINSESKKFGNGGNIGFNALANKVAKRYEGKKVAPKYQGEYGKRYSQNEAKEVGRKVAGKVYWQQQGRKFDDGGITDYDWANEFRKTKTYYVVLFAEENGKEEFFEGNVQARNEAEALYEARKGFEFNYPKKKIIKVKIDSSKDKNKYDNGGGVEEITPELNNKIFKRAEAIYLKEKGKNKKDFDMAFDKAIVEFGFDPKIYHRVMNEIGADEEEYENGGSVDGISDLIKG